MKSLRQLTSGLTGVRLDATSISLWNAVVSVNECARAALNEALLQYPVEVGKMYTSGVVGSVVVLPRDARRLISVTRVATTGVDALPIHHVRLRPTASTVWLEMYDAADDIVEGRLDIHYVGQQPEMPTDVKLVSDSVGSVQVSGGYPGYTWPPPPALIEFHATSGGYDTREVAMYTACTTFGFTGLQRGVEGMSQSWSPGSNVSLCWATPEGPSRAVMLLSQAIMYEFFVRDRALYERFTAIASVQSLDLGDLMNLIASFEARAELAHSRERKSPAPVQSGRRRPLPK